MATTKKPAKKRKEITLPTHYTAGQTRKFQANGPVAWGDVFREIAERIGGPGTPEGRGIRAALAFAVANKALIGSAVELSGDRKRAIEFVDDGIGASFAAPKKAKAKKPRKAKKAK